MADLAPLWQAPLLIQVHALAALAALALGAAQFALPKGRSLHRAMGWTWALCMMVVASSAFGISGVGGPSRLSWIHGLAAAVLVLLPMAVLAARRGRIRAHRNGMLGLYLGALVIAGAFTLLPGRIMGATVFGW